MVLILFILVGVAKVIFAKNAQLEDVLLERKLLFFLSNNKLWQMEMEGNIIHEKLVNDAFVVDYDFDEIGNRLFWIDQAGQIIARNINGQSVDKCMFRYYLAGSGTRITYNTVTDKFYIIDGQSQEIDMIESMGKNQTVLFKRNPIKEEYVIREKPRKIVLDRQAGLMFILTDLNGVKNIYQSKTDGTSKKLLISNIGGDEIGINSNHKRIFWANTKQKVIESANYEGQNRAFVAKIKNSVALNIYNNELFWIINESEWGCSKSAVYGCRLESGTCEISPDCRIQLEDQCRNPRSLKIVGLQRI
ncbi:PREDICTED: low-density lipoprotein receptor-related protein 2-like [Ceratosolen solmsi marchali]|uniref:Low-density lipoprotein receptor-related protein 2-like n=1 Tax=Ceratosolen solmsi marchali TaxID=326594 RepID=A0AAJ7DTN2_9HYME|nr:PREDICTED: low-density lipoprotein receptor-related protein 2-like [Ceratosolen solmsi marchali]